MTYMEPDNGLVRSAKPRQNIDIWLLRMSAKLYLHRDSEKKLEFSIISRLLITDEDKGWPGSHISFDPAT